MDGGQERISRAPLTFREVCAHYGITERALRYYEALEILSPRGSGAARLYDARQQVRLELTLRARRFRVKLEDARQVIELYDTKGPVEQARRWRQIVSRQRKSLAVELEELMDIRYEMDAVLRGEGDADACDCR